MQLKQIYFNHADCWLSRCTDPKHFVGELGVSRGVVGVHTTRPKVDAKVIASMLYSKLLVSRAARTVSCQQIPRRTELQCKSNWSGQE
jgi:hypothetical protein